MSELNPPTNKSVLVNTDLLVLEYKRNRDEIKQLSVYVTRLKLISVVITLGMWFMIAISDEYLIVYGCIPQIVLVLISSIEDVRLRLEITRSQESLSQIRCLWAENNAADTASKNDYFDRYEFGDNTIVSNGQNIYIILLFLSILVPLYLYLNLYSDVDYTLKANHQSSAEQGEEDDIGQGTTILSPRRPRRNRIVVSSSEGEIEARIDEMVSHLPKGLIAFNPPENMVQGEKERVEVRIAHKEIGDVINRGLIGKGRVKKDQISIGAVMKVSLVAEKEDFDIAKYNSDEQVVVGKEFAQWAWDVKPLKSGILDLHLMVTIPIKNEAVGDTFNDLLVKDHKISVAVNKVYLTKRFLEYNWQWVIASLILPFLIWIYKKFEDRRIVVSTPKRKRKLRSA